MASNSPKVAFLVVCWKNREIIDECLSALQGQSYKNTAIYVIDNDSQDGTVNHIKTAYPDVHLIASNKNNGFARGNNILVKEVLKDTDVRYIALINSDAMLDSKWTEELVGYLSDKPRVASAQGITLDYYNRTTIDADHVYLRTNFQAVQHGYIEKFREATAYPRRVFGVNAAAALYTREFIEDQKYHTLFDERFFMYLEDVDVSFRALITGWDNYHVPAAKAYHMGSVSAKKRSNIFHIEMTVRNQAALLFKNMPTGTFFHFFINALKFERHFYKYIGQTYGANAAKRVKRARVIGILRVPLYSVDRIRNMRRRRLSTRDLERIMEQDGIRY